MSFIYGKEIKIVLYGHSHQENIGLVIEGLPVGTELPKNFIDQQLTRRRPNNFKISTARVENDEYSVISGLSNNKYNGSPLVINIINGNYNQKDYSPLFRPSHADYAAYHKYNNHLSLDGGAFFSGRMTSLLVIVGSVLNELLKKKNIEIFSNIKQVGTQVGSSIMENFDYNILNSLQQENFPVLDFGEKKMFIEEIESAKKDGDSVGGILEVVIDNLPIGVGEPYFDSLESRISQLLFSVPAIKGVEFGLGFEFGSKRGSEVNDQLIINKQKPMFLSNNNGGITGGISTGQRVYLKVVVKPTPTISKEQNYYDYERNTMTKQEINGRHDPAIISRIAVVIESVTSLAIYDLLLEYDKVKGE